MCINWEIMGASNAKSQLTTSGTGGGEDADTRTCHRDDGAGE